MKCPYCSEEILDGAKKCRYCGEWLDKFAQKIEVSSIGRGSTDARAVAKGLKEKERQDYLLGCGGLIILIIAFSIGYWTHWFVGVFVFILLVALMSVWYYKE